MRKTIGPFLATGVVLVTATAIVANPLVTSPPDKFISTAEWAANGDSQDHLGFDFLKSIGTGHQGSPMPIAGLEELLNGLINAAPSISHGPTGVSSLPVVETPEQTSAADEIPPSSVDNAAAPTFPGEPSETIQAAMAAIADIGSGTGAAGVKLIEQLSVAPAVVFSLLGQVLAGTLSPEDALRRLIAAPLAAILTGFPNLTGDPQIDALFSEGALRPLFDALIDNLPTPIGQVGGAIDAIDRGLTHIATQIRDNLDPPAHHKSSSLRADTDVLPISALAADPEQPGSAAQTGQPVQPRQPARPGSESDASKISALAPGAPQPPRASSRPTGVPSVVAAGNTPQSSDKAEPPTTDSGGPTLSRRTTSAPGSANRPDSEPAAGGTGRSPGPTSGEN
jgi:hypothetical protein